MASIFILVVSIFAISSCYGDSRTGFGFFLPNHDILGSFTGGARVFNDLNSDKSCVISTPRNRHRKNIAYYKDTQSFFSSLSTQTGLSASLRGIFTMGFTFNSKSRSISSTDYDANGASLYMYSYLRDEVLSSDCKNNLALNDKLQAAFEALPLEVTNPKYRSSWAEYETFLERFGSHYVSTTHFGAMVEQFNFAKTEKHYTQKDFETRVCADFLGPSSVGAVNVSTCFGLDKTKINSAISFEMSSQFTVLGGTNDARTALLLDRSPKNVKTFLETAKDDNDFAYQFSSIWELLQTRYVRTEHYAKALNLEFFFAGFLSHSCSYRKDSLSGFVLREFKTAEDHTVARPSYKCEMPSRGCHAKSDCNIGGWGVVCYCYGDSCVDYKEKEIAGVLHNTAVIRHTKAESNKVGINNSCTFKLGEWCVCNESWDGGAKAIWSSGMRSVTK